QTGSGPQFSWFPDNARFVNGIFGSDPANDCSDIGKPCSTIAHAIDQADEGDQIDIAAGTYTEMLTIDKSLTLRGAGKDPLSGTIIQAHPDPGMATGRVIYIPEENVVSIQGVIIRHGNASGGGESGRGGGIRVENSTLNLTDVMFE